MKKIYVALAAAGCVAGMPLLAQSGNQAAAPKMHSVHGELILYKEANFNGEQMIVDEANSAVRTEWNIRSLSLHPGDRWQICARPRFREPCIILTRNVADATMIGIEGQIGSARPAPEPAAAAPAGN
ncbi:MAG TPA: hypothetical protein VEC11_12865 [Allosphingosinicella sp.]|nr:hypothetical protein [Allosphingosinicella sp.]